MFVLKILVLFFLSFSAYGEIPFYPMVPTSVPIVNFPAGQTKLIPWCPTTSNVACASYLANQALVIPSLSTQSYSLPMVLLNKYPSVNSTYDPIKPTFRREFNKGSSRNYFRNVDTGDIQIQENGKILGEGPVVYMPIENFQNPSTNLNLPPAPIPTNTTPSTSPPVSTKDFSNTSQLAPPPPAPIDSLSKKALENIILEQVLPQDRQIKEPDQENTILLDSDSSIQAAETDIPEHLKDKCLIGGLLRDRLTGGKCPTKDNDCGQKKDGFLCGTIFNEECISRTPIETLSKRCVEASKGKALSQKKYKKLLQNDPVAGYCKYHPEDTLCQDYPSLSSLLESKTEAKSCEKCERTSKNNNQEALQDILTAFQSNFADSISDTIYNRAKCASRLCSKHWYCSPKEDDRKCRYDNGQCISQKFKNNASLSRTKSLGKCAGYTIQSVVLTLREQLKEYCESKGSSMNQCTQESSNNDDICNKNFVLPSALCALNLDGKDRISNSSHVSVGVKNSCDDFWPLPTHITVNGKKIPLFKKITTPNDPNDLPDGTIIVLQSTTKLGKIHGHIEMKTKNKNCKGIGENCFCSDFCEKRTKEDYSSDGTYTPLAAFQINPELKKALKQ